VAAKPAVKEMPPPRVMPPSIVIAMIFSFEVD
jgi:hypothetical protein